MQLTVREAVQCTWLLGCWLACPHWETSMALCRATARAAYSGLWFYIWKTCLWKAGWSQGSCDYDDGDDDDDRASLLININYFPLCWSHLMFLFFHQHFSDHFRPGCDAFCVPRRPKEKSFFYSREDIWTSRRTFDDSSSSQNQLELLS